MPTFAAHEQMHDAPQHPQEETRNCSLVALFVMQAHLHPEGLGRFGIDYVTPVGCAALQRSCRPAVLGPSANRMLVPDQRGSRLFTSVLAACRVNPFAPLRIQPLAAPRCLGFGTQKPREAGVL